MESDDDAQLLQRFREGDRKAFTELVIRYQKPIYNAAFWILRKAEDASDVTQTVFLKVVERLDDYDPQYKFFSWIYRIAVNESLNLQRRNGHEDELDDEAEYEGPQSATPDWRLDEAERSRRLQDALMRISTKRPHRAHAAALFRMQLPGDRAGAADRREDREIAPVRCAPAASRPAG